MDRLTSLLMYVVLLSSTFYFSPVVGEEGNPNEKVIHYTGQELEDFVLGNSETEVRYRTQMQDSTCYRDVPYEDTECEDVPRYDTQCTNIPGRNDCHTEYDNECHDETRYRQECHQEPDRQVCRDVTRQRRECKPGPSREVCRNVTRHREECSQGPSRRQCRNVTRHRQECTNTGDQRTCHTVPARQQCRTNSSGQTRCTTIPARQVCEGGPQRVCRDVPYEEEVCENVPGERQCRQVAYQDRECRTVEGEDICRNVDYQDRECRTVEGENRCRQVSYREQVCEDVPREECEWIPSRQDCRQVQVGSDEVCHQVTRYRAVSYACQKPVDIPYTVVLKLFETSMVVNFTKAQDVNDFDLKVSLDTKGEESLQVETEDSSLAIFSKKIPPQQESPASMELNDKADDEAPVRVNNSAQYNVDIFHFDSLYQSLFTLENLRLTKESISFTLPKQKMTKELSLLLTLTTEEQNMVHSRVLLASEFTVQPEGKMDHYFISLKKLGVSVEEYTKYHMELTCIPTFKKKLLYPQKKAFYFTKSDDLFVGLNDSDLDDLKNYLNQVTIGSLVDSSLHFRFPNHKMLQDVKVRVTIPELLDRYLDKGELEWNIGESSVDLTADLEALGIALDPLQKYSVKIEIEYLFTKDSPLPEDFTFSAQAKKEMQTVVGNHLRAEILSAVKSVSEVNLYKKSMTFKLGRHEYLDGLKIHLLITKKGKVKLDQILTSEHMKVEEIGNSLLVDINFNQFDTKISGWGKHDVKIEIERHLDSRLVLTAPLETNHLWSGTRDAHKR